MDNHYHEEILQEGMKEIADGLRDRSLLGGFYLAGGTALALYLGHRKSYDLDFFSHKLFDEEVTLQRYQILPGFRLLSRSPSSINSVIRSTKVSLLGYEYKMLKPLAMWNGIHIAGLEDIACMKISAIANRGTKRDIVDLYFLCQIFNLSDILAMFFDKFETLNVNKIHIIKSLVYFDDADKEPMPNMLKECDWDEVKKFFVVAVED